jgi:hypothetical protein
LFGRWIDPKKRRRSKDDIERGRDARRLRTLYARDCDGASRPGFIHAGPEEPTG